MSYDLPAIIRDIPSWESKSAAECREYLGETTTVMVHRTWTASDLASVFGVGPYNDFRKATQAWFPAMSDLLVSGIDLGDDSEEGIRVGLGRVKSALVAAGLSTLASLVDDVLVLGQDTRTRWARLSDEDLPDADAFETAYAAAELFERKQAASASLREWVAAAEAQINAGVPWSEIDGKTTEELQ